MKRIVLVLAGIAAGVTLALTIPASAAPAGHDGGYPTPTVTATPTQPLPTVTPTPTQPLPTPTVPVVNPFAGCRFTFTVGETFDPTTFRFVRRVIPAIICRNRFGVPRVYDLVR